MKRYTENKCTKESCELCSCINAKPVDMERHGAKLLTVRIKINNVCIGKKVAIAAVLCDEGDRIVAFKGFITMAQEENACDHEACGTIERKIVFVIPEHEQCDTRKLKVRTISNYIYPCD
ncbi:hypothetical protein [Clostridium sp.]|uniref:hypothetical protein n=1 Tax=Clostridium sp. TaxID=1506 RepID=UPI00284478E0|nr:hypothetical protein [Clostridium sp.]MDR3594692.1 hypothetical protein [Clostridium sp.]